MNFLQRRRQAYHEAAKFMSNLCPQCGVRNFRIHYHSFSTTQYRRCKRCGCEYAGGSGIGDAIVILCFGTLIAGVGAVLIGDAPIRVVLVAWVASVPFLLAGVIALLGQFRASPGSSGGFEVIRPDSALPAAPTSDRTGADREPTDSTS
ncbi:MAG TPA: hypothetical protein VFC78_15780 [Tepidisphaeraceae bacterium]|nr:hypothetical protein [Tepidisphaeraceae bacterium]